MSRFSHTSLFHAFPAHAARQIQNPKASIMCHSKETNFVFTPTSSTSTSLSMSENDGDDTENKKKQTRLSVKVFDVIFDLVSYVIQFLGVAFSLGLILNICGYGYTFDFEHGLEIDRMEVIRKELQFKREIVRETRGVVSPDTFENQASSSE